MNDQSPGPGDYSHTKSILKTRK